MTPLSLKHKHTQNYACVEEAAMDHGTRGAGAAGGAGAYYDIIVMDPWTWAYSAPSGVRRVCVCFCVCVLRAHM
jgi:hypothetical protein